MNPPTNNPTPAAPAKKNSTMAMEIKFDAATLKALLPMLQKALPYLFGLALVGAFGYTAYVINAALNVQPAATQTTIPALPKVTFDKKVMDSLKDRSKVDDNVPSSGGSTDPF